MIKLKQCALIIIAAFSAFLSVNVQATQVAVWRKKTNKQILIGATLNCKVLIHVIGQKIISP